MEKVFVICIKTRIWKKLIGMKMMLHNLTYYTFIVKSTLMRNYSFIKITVTGLKFPYYTTVRIC